ncbi:MAG TPA: endo alpha-1,4 polygalactosaminidase [Solirubrobacterales bacterium]
MTKRSLAATLLTTLAVLLLAPSAAARWQPEPTVAAWQWQLQGRIDTSIDAAVYEVDGFEISARTVAKLHRQGRKVICYLDIGAWESYRPDAGRFPKAVLGRAYEGYPDERWLDIRRIDLLAPILRRRFDLCRRKGFDAVEPDNIAGYENKTGFPLTGADQLRFNRWVAREVHKRGMSVALKNDPGQVRQLVGNFDFAVVEECFAYEECGRFSPFVDAGKAVFVAEYEEPLTAICGEAERLRFSVIRKDYDLFARPWEPCFPAGS